MKFKTFRYLFMVMAIALGVKTHGQILTLDSVMGRINRNNPMLQEYDFKVRALNTYAEGAKSWMAPMVGFGPYWFPYKRQEATHDFDPEDGMYMAVLEQDIPNPGKLRARSQYLSSKASVEEEGRAIAYNQIRAEAKQLYYDLILAEKKLAVLDESKSILELMLKLARLRYPYNQSSLGMIYKTEGRLHEADNMRLMTESEVTQAKIRLNALMNVPVHTPFEADSTILTKLPRFDVDTAALGSTRSDIRQIERKVNEMKLNQQLQRSNAKPDIRLRFEHMIQRDPAMPNMFSAMVMVSIPIAPWSNKMYRAEVKGMQYDIEAMKREQQGILTEARGMVMSMSTQLDRMAQQLDNYSRKIIPAMQKNYETVMLAYEENKEQLTSVVDAWEAYNMTRMDYLEKLDEYFQMIVEYEKQLEI